MKPRVTPVMVRRPIVRTVPARKAVAYYIAVGIAGGLALLAAVSTGVLLVRESRAAAPARPTVQVPPPPPEAAPPASPSLDSRPAAPPTRPSRPPARPRTVPFRGNVYPAEARVAEARRPNAVTVPPALTTQVEPAPPVLVIPPSRPLDEMAAAPAASLAPEPGIRRPGPLRKVFGSILRPFRTKRPSANAAVQ